MQGRIIQNISGLYQVLSEHGSFRCRARGIFRKRNITLSAGDMVEFEPLQNNEGLIRELLPRKNSFVRPNVSNVDMICYVISARFPKPDTYLIDKMTVLSALKNVDILLMLNKIDLDDDKSASEILNIYEKLGFQVIRCCANEMDRSAEILRFTAGKIVVLTGNTGVGKSSIINTLGLGVNVKVDEISQKLGRGRHTTREVTFFERNDGGLLGDTPGFGNIDIALEDDLNCDNLVEYFSEFAPWKSQCRFADCTHTGENGCMIADKVSIGEIPQTRYQSYLLMYDALKQRDENKKY